MNEVTETEIPAVVGNRTPVFTSHTLNYLWCETVEVAVISEEFLG
jgi:hypothetical protein